MLQLINCNQLFLLRRVGKSKMIDLPPLGERNVSCPPVNYCVKENWMLKPKLELEVGKELLEIRGSLICRS